MIRVGLTGGYATGKSFVAAELAQLGCRVIYADQLGHQLLQAGGAAYQPVLRLFGDSILQPDGLQIDRKKLAALVFGDPTKLAQLNAIVHPAVYALETALTEQFRERDQCGIVVTEAAILIETGRYSSFDRLIVTMCSEQTQIVRGMKRDGLDREGVMARIDRQMPLTDKQQYAHYLIDTDGTPEQTLDQVRTVHRELSLLAERSCR